MFKKLIIISIIGITILTTSTAQAGFWNWLKELYSNADNNLSATLRILTPLQGGTGIATTTESNDGKYLKVSSTTPNLVYSFDTPAGGSFTTTTITAAGTTLSKTAYIFATSSETNLGLTIGALTDTLTWTPTWIGTLADSRITSASNWNSKATSSITISAGLGMSGGGDLTANRTLTLNMLGGTCGGTDKVSSLSATGTIICTADEGAGGGITSFNGSTSSTQTMALTGATGGFNWTTANGVHTLNIATSTGSATGLLLSGDWTTFNNKQSALTFPLVYASTTHITATTPLTITSGVLSMPTSTASQNGFLLATDWTTFNAKITTTTLSASNPIVYNNQTGAFSWTNSLGYITTTSLSVTYAPLSYNNTTGVFTLPTSTASQSGFLSSGDWTTFNNKQATISFPLAVASTSLTGGLGLTLTTNDMACDTASGSIFGCLTSADWTTFNGKQNNVSWPIAFASSTHLTATLPLLITAGDLSLTGRLSTINSIATSTGSLIVGKADTTGWYGLGVGANGKVLMASSTATNGVNWETIVASASAGGANTNVQVNEAGSIAGYSTLTYASSTGLLTVGSSTITGFLKIPNGAGGTTINASGLLGIDTTTRTLNFHDGTAEVRVNPEQCSQPFTIQYPTSTAGTYYNAKGIPFAFMNATSTLTYIYGVNASAGDTATFNITYNPSINSATTTYQVFTSQQTITSTSTATRLTPTASSTPNQFDWMRISFSSVSSTQFSVGNCWRENP